MNGVCTILNAKGDQPCYRPLCQSLSRFMYSTGMTWRAKKNPPVRIASTDKLMGRKFLPSCSIQHHLSDASTAQLPSGNMLPPLLSPFDPHRSYPDSECSGDGRFSLHSTFRSKCCKTTQSDGSKAPPMAPTGATPLSAFLGCLWTA